jgi:hypothetical protein
MAAMTGLKDFFLGKNANQSKQSAIPSTRTSTSSAVSAPIIGLTSGLGTIASNSTSKMGDYSKQIISYLLAIGIILLIILIFVHFFITPIFSYQPGAPGIFVLPGLDDGILFWNKTNTGLIPNDTLPIQNLSSAYSLNVDIFIQDPHVHFSTHPRILFRRGGRIRSSPTGNTLLGLLDNYNLACALLPDTNDLIVSVLNIDNNTENAIISNVPIQEPFRLGIVLMTHALEVYINGHLMKTRTFISPPKSVLGDIYPVSGIETNMAKLRNLKIWSKQLTSSEMRKATPSLATTSDFGSGPMSNTSSCLPPDMSADISSYVESAMQKASDKLSSV